MDGSEERIALYIDFENLAIGAKQDLNGHALDLKPITDALAERGRVVVRRAYADWSMFSDARRMLSEHHVEMIEIPQLRGAIRKNAADIKMAVDAIELSLERDYVTTFVVATGDSDFTPLVHKLRELNKRVIGIGLRDSTSALLPPACDEFLFYENLEGLDLPQRRRRRRARSDEEGTGEVAAAPDEDIERLVTQTLAGLQRSTDGVVLASGLKRALLRKDPTFSEADHGFRGFRELLRNLEQRGLLDLTEGPARGDPEVSFRHSGGREDHGFELLAAAVAETGAPVPMAGLKDAIRKRQPGFTEKAYGYGGFLQFSKAAAARGLVAMEWSEEQDDWVLTSP